MPGESPLLMKIRAMESSLSVTERKIARYILDHPRGVIQLSITGLAEASGVSDATVVRLAKRLGMHGYQQLKVALAQDIVSPIQSIHEDISEDDMPADVLAKVFSGTVHSLEYTRSIINPQQFEQAVEALDTARHVAVFGCGNSGALAQDMQHKLMRAGISAYAYTDGHMQCIAAVQLGPGDVCVSISHSGSSRDVIEAARLAADGGAKVVCMTNIGRNPLADMADIRLDTASRETEYHIVALSSRIAQYVIIDSLYAAISLRRRGVARESALVIEEALQQRKY